jgi:hypothetical protein
VADFFSADAGVGGGPSVSVPVPPAAQPPAPATPAAPPNLAPQPGGPLAPSAITVFNVSGDTDSAGKANLGTDGNPATAWKTDTYRKQFPSFKPGIGLLVSFPQPVNPSRISIDSPSPGTQVEIRTAPSANPALGDTAVLANATLTAGSTTIDLSRPAQTQHILIWITRLAGTEQHYQSVVNEITFPTP